MAHEVENMVSTKGQVPWHGLGVVVPQTLITAEEVIKYVPELKFKVIKRQNRVEVNGNIVSLDDSFSTIRVNEDLSESVLCGCVGRNYTPIQNVDGFTFFDNVIGTGEAIYETAGVLKQGRAVFLLAVLPDYIKILGSDADTIKKYVLLANWHDGTSALLAQFVNIRVVCNNTLNMALNDATSQVAIRHTASAEERMKEAARIMGIVNQYNVEIGKVFNKMALAKISADDLLMYVNTLLPIGKDATDVVKKHTQEKRDKVLELVEVGHGADLDTARNTVWGAYNAFVEYVDHGKKSRTPDGRATSLLVGLGRQMKQTAYNLAVDFAENKRPVNNINLN